MDTTTVTLILFVAGAGAVVALLMRLLRDLRELKRTDPAAGLVVLQTQLDALREQVRSSLEGGRQELDRRLEHTNQVVGEVREGLGQVDRQIRTVNEATRDLRGLQELLRSPKVRGGVGEYLLSELLAQVLPQALFELQYEFEGGERVDAALRIGEGLVPVDAKFPLENFQRIRSAAAEADEVAGRNAARQFRGDVRRHIDAIAARYVRPDQGTFDFALMYIPSEAVYQEVLHQDGNDGLDLLHYALSRQVVPVSPQTFYAYLQVIVLGMRGMTIEERAREIMGQLAGIRTRLERFSESFDLAARHLANAQKQTEEAGRRLARLDTAISGMADRDEQPETERPAAEATASRPSDTHLVG